MSYLVFSKQNVCYLLVDASAVNRHPLFFANLISSCVSHESLSSLELWRCIFYGSWQIVLGDYIFGAAPDALKRFVRPNVIAIKRAVSRHDEICTIFYELDSGVFVKKCTLASLAGCQLNGSPIFFGMAYDMYLQDFAARQMWEEWRAALLFFIDEAFARFYLDEKVLQGDAIDAVARNAVLNDRGRVDFFDLECAEYTCPSKTFFLYRLCCSIEGRDSGYLAGSGFSCRYELYCYLCDYFSLGSGSYLKDLRGEADFQAWINGRPKKIKYFKGLKSFGREESLANKFRRLCYALRLLGQWRFYD